MIDLDALERLADGLEFSVKMTGGQSKHSVADIRAAVAELRAARRVVEAAKNMDSGKTERSNSGTSSAELRVALADYDRLTK